MQMMFNLLHTTQRNFQSSTIKSWLKVRYHSSKKLARRVRFETKSICKQCKVSWMTWKLSNRMFPFYLTKMMIIRTTTRTTHKCSGVVDSWSRLHILLTSTPEGKEPALAWIQEGPQAFLCQWVWMAPAYPSPGRWVADKPHKAKSRIPWCHRLTQL